MLLILIEPLYLGPFCIDRLKFFGNIRGYLQQNASVSLNALLFVEDPVIVAWFLALPMKAFKINSSLGRECKYWYQIEDSLIFT